MIHVLDIVKFKMKIRTVRQMELFFRFKFNPLCYGKFGGVDVMKASFRVFLGLIFRTYF